MNECSPTKELHSNNAGTIRFCPDCASFQLKVKGLLFSLEREQIYHILQKIALMRTEVEFDPEFDEVENEVRIRLTKDMYLCLSLDELDQLIELLELGECMHNVNNLMKL